MPDLFSNFEPPPSDGPYREGRSSVGVARCDITANRHGGHSNSEAAHTGVMPKKERMVDQILRFIRIRGDYGATCEEIVGINTWMRYTSVSARLSEMKRDGLIREDGRTRPTSGGDQAAVVVAVEQVENHPNPQTQET